jgi:hypothetical protein
VDLRGRFSNPEALETVALAAQAVDGIQKDGSQVASAAPPLRRWRLVDRRGEEIISDLIRESHSGATRRVLAQRYQISLSSVKRVLRREHD